MVATDATVTRKHLPVAGCVPVVLGVDPGGIAGGRDGGQLTEGRLRSRRQ